jgi:5-methylcytosine-specific restriction endonuclease McrBC regulatory subunit McrC
MYLEKQMENFHGEINAENREIAGDMLEAEDVKYSASALKRLIIIIENNQNSLNQLTETLKAVDDQLADARKRNDDAEITKLEG